MRISPADGGASKDTSARACWLRGFLLGAMRAASLHCGRDVIGNTPFVTRRILFDTWITFITIHERSDCVSASATGRLRLFLSMGGADCCRKTGRAVAAKILQAMVSGDNDP